MAAFTRIHGILQAGQYQRARFNLWPISRQRRLNGRRCVQSQMKEQKVRSCSVVHFCPGVLVASDGGRSAAPPAPESGEPVVPPPSGGGSGKTARW